ncbi:DUF6489 family protein [Marinobacter sp. X15-166B]|uniref:DUF6489 family protein n=1 Tax=Marinobacter sp. X15-166B TaxID=1897620 RepID=UPI00085C49EB|nr:DUF6489 family protein [Marinobacter sp. X15-166B]OEY65456.1 hypothetical protein BG841_02605 [Marinobacter sp. X15-166B]
MKINIEIDMSPEEFRKVMGLPDIEPVQKQLMAKMEEKMNQSLDEMSDPELLMKRIMPMGLQGAEQFQAFFSRFANLAAGKKSTKSDGSEDS